MPFCLMAVTPHHSQAQWHFEFPSSLITDLSRMPSYSKTSPCPLPPAPAHPLLLLPFCCPCWTSCYTFHSPAYCLLSQPSSTISPSPYPAQMKTVLPMITHTTSTSNFLSTAEESQEEREDSFHHWSGLATSGSLWHSDVKLLQTLPLPNLTPYPNFLLANQLASSIIVLVSQGNRSISDAGTSLPAPNFSF